MFKSQRLTMIIACVIKAYLFSPEGLCSFHIGRHSRVTTVRVSNGSGRKWSSSAQPRVAQHPHTDEHLQAWTLNKQKKKNNIVLDKLSSSNKNTHIQLCSVWLQGNMFEIGLLTEHVARHCKVNKSRSSRNLTAIKLKSIDVLLWIERQDCIYWQ